MLIVYDRETRQVVGHCGQIFENGEWREPTVDEVFGHLKLATLEALYVNEVTEAKLFRYGPENLRLAFDEKGTATGIELKPALKLRCDARDADGDGVPDLPADGAAATVVTASTTDRAAGVAITFRTTHGALSSRTATTTQDGAASVNLRASTETVLATVTATADGYRSGSLQLEMIPGAPS
ncbi:Ig-like domain-containing protein [Actinomycetes bacterium KLBMP 9797]